MTLRQLLTRVTQETVASKAMDLELRMPDGLPIVGFTMDNESLYLSDSEEDTK